MSTEAAMTVAIPTFNDDPRVFERTLASALASPDAGQLVVVDMSTEPAVRGVCERLGDRVRYEAFPQSGGVSHSRNRCLDLADTRKVAFLDSDSFPEPGWLRPLSERLDEDDVAVTGSRILAEWERRPDWLLRSVPAADWLSLFDLGCAPLEVPRIMGTSYALDRERVGERPFDESVGRKPGWPLAMEEGLLCRSAWKAGWRVVYEPGSVVRHHVPRSRSRWRWMWVRAHTAGRETRVGGRFEPLPRPRFGVRDFLFQATVAVPFALGAVRPPRPRD